MFCNFYTLFSFLIIFHLYYSRFYTQLRNHLFLLPILFIYSYFLFLIIQITLSFFFFFFFFWWCVKLNKLLFVILLLYYSHCHPRSLFLYVTFVFINKYIIVNFFFFPFEMTFMFIFLLISNLAGLNFLGTNFQLNFISSTIQLFFF